MGANGDIIQTTPIKVMENVAAVSMGDTYAAAIKTDGSLWMWGSNEHGQLGNGTTRQAFEPVKVMDDVVSVSVYGGMFRAVTAAIKSDGSLWLWGNNEDGEIIVGEAEHITRPVKFMDHVRSVDVGNRGIVAVQTDGSLWSWGKLLSDGSRSTLTKKMDGVLTARHMSTERTT